MCTFHQECTNTPVPEILAAYERGSSFFLLTVSRWQDLQYQSGNCNERARSPLDHIAKSLFRFHRRACLCYPPTFRRIKSCLRSFHKTTNMCFYLGHFSPSNTIVDKNSFKLLKIIYSVTAAYYPSYLESPYHCGSKPFNVLQKDPPNNPKMFSVLGGVLMNHLQLLYRKRWSGDEWSNNAWNNQTIPRNYHCTILS